MLDACHFRILQADAKRANKALTLQRPPAAGTTAWLDEKFMVAPTIKDRELSRLSVRGLPRSARLPVGTWEREFERSTSP